MDPLPNLLIVDDNEDNLFLLEAAVRNIKVNLIMALSGAESLEKARGIELALAIIDVRMPVMSGYDLATRLNDERSADKVPVIFLTAGHLDDMEIIKGYSSGAVDYIFKPLGNFILVSKIEVFIDLFKQKQKITRDAGLLRESAEKLYEVNAALKSSEEKYRSYIDRAPDGVFVADETGKYIEVNEAACRITGYSREELLSMSIRDLLPDEAINEGIEQFRSLMKTGRSGYDLLFRHKNGSYRWWTLEAVRISDKRLLGFAKDITLRKEMEGNLLNQQHDLELQNQELTRAKEQAGIASAELLRVNRLLDSMVENIPNMIFLKDADTLRYVLFNRAGEDLLGLSREELLGRNDYDFFTSEHAGNYIKKDREVLAGRKMVDIAEEPVQTKHLGMRFVHTKKVPILNDQGEPEYLMGISEDITARKYAEEELKISLGQLHDLTKYIEKVRENERMAISRDLHDDLGQALTAVKIDLGMIRQHVSDSEPLSRIAKVSDLVGDTIKTVQRITSELRPQIIDDLGLEAAMEWYTGEFAERTNIEVALDLESGLNLSSDVSLIIFRILQESLTNIARHSGAGRVEIGLGLTRERIFLRISDNGRGITEREIRSNKSFGIMSMKERAASLGGTFDISRAAGGGTEIIFMLPLNQQGTDENSDM
ncbi:MAG: PAS domain S-box protein [Bacteroidia bacterium]|nr:PAS domain S-box protein [Bacteroidia bacterium]